MNKKRQAYWSPRSVKDTDEAIAMFWEWYNSMEISLGGVGLMSHCRLVKIEEMCANCGRIRGKGDGVKK